MKTIKDVNEQIAADIEKVDTTNFFEEIKAAHFADGAPVYYNDDQYPGGIVKEYPSGRVELVDLDEKIMRLSSKLSKPVRPIYTAF